MTQPAFRSDAARFSDADTPFLSARRVAEALGVTLTELSALTGLARNTLTAKSGARTVDIALGPIVRILALGSEMAGDDWRAAISLTRHPIPGWTGKTACDLVRERKVDK